MSNIEETLIIKSEAEDGSLKGRVWMESKKIWRIAFPAILARMALFGVILVTQAFVGHMGALELSAFAVVQTILVRFVSGITLGMSSATETLCGQAFGAGQYHMMGIYLQRSWIVSTSAATIFVPVFIFATQIFKLLGEEDDIATEAGIISLWFIPVLYSTVFSSTMQMFLQAQLNNFVIIWLTVATFAIHVLLSWILVYLLNYGIPGAMVAMNISFWLLVFGEFVYILGGWCPDAWRGFTKAAFSNLLPVIKLSISSGVMIWYVYFPCFDYNLFILKQLSKHCSLMLWPEWPDFMASRRRISAVGLRYLFHQPPLAFTNSSPTITEDKPSQPP
ncbi:hypothetical protein Pint_20801 [Pistacia integerrima]|uniref:Uncharacterized protein n=1 Tax=Pistacia integerrima TaxID=434235 RepID=A0ACC0X9K3_9ROSI|nr:hypothetical protein Pint_20801 [Pistacia integerrima]